MKVYVLKIEWPYEGSQIIAVCTSVDAAKAKVSDAQEWRIINGCIVSERVKLYGSYQITPYEVEE